LVAAYLAFPVQACLLQVAALPAAVVLAGMVLQPAQRADRQPTVRAQAALVPRAADR
jgi:hypothetical protein